MPRSGAGRGRGWWHIWLPRAGDKGSGWREAAESRGKERCGQRAGLRASAAAAPTAGSCQPPAVPGAGLRRSSSVWQGQLSWALGQAACPAGRAGPCRLPPPVPSLRAARVGSEFKAPTFRGLNPSSPQAPGRLRLTAAWGRQAPLCLSCRGVTPCTHCCHPPGTAALPGRGAPRASPCPWPKGRPAAPYAQGLLLPAPGEDAAQAAGTAQPCTPGRGASSSPRAGGIAGSAGRTGLFPRVPPHCAIRDQPGQSSPREEGWLPRGVSWGQTAASSCPERWQWCWAAGPRVTCPSPAINPAAGAGEPITAGLKSTAGQVPAGRFQPGARAVASASAISPPLRPGVDMTGQMVLAVLLLGELSRPSAGPRLRSIPPRGSRRGVSWGSLLPAAQGGCTARGGVGRGAGVGAAQHTPPLGSAGLCWAPLGSAGHGQPGVQRGSRRAGRLRRLCSAWARNSPVSPQTGAETGVEGQHPSPSGHWHPEGRGERSWRRRWQRGRWGALGQRPGIPSEGRCRGTTLLAPVGPQQGPRAESPDTSPADHVCPLSPAVGAVPRSSRRSQPRCLSRSRDRPSRWLHDCQQLQQRGPAALRLRLRLRRLLRREPVRWVPSAAPRRQRAVELGASGAGPQGGGRTPGCRSPGWVPVPREGAGPQGGPSPALTHRLPTLRVPAALGGAGHPLHLRFRGR